MIAANPSISRKELAKQVGITSDGIKYHLANLQKDTGKYRRQRAWGKNGGKK
jgi:predicted ArsR family transcriptional regulator